MNKYKLKEILTIEQKPFQGTVYDLEVEGDHSYNVNGIAVHNSRCVTRRNTGVGVPQLKAIRDIRQALPFAIIIADGGIKYTGDIPKALKYANAVMVGSLMAGTSETPGHVYENEQGEHYKVYGGSASGERKTETGGDNEFVEGVVSTVKFKGEVKYILRGIKQGLQSSMSYAGANDMKEFRERSVLADIGSGAKSESRL